MKSKIMIERFNRFIVIVICFLIINSLFLAGWNQTTVKAEEVQTTDRGTKTTASDTQTSNRTDGNVTKKIDKNKLKKPKVKIKKRYEKNVKLKWKKIKNAKYYIIYRADEKKQNYKKVKKTKKTYFIDKNAVARKTYKYKVVAVTNVSGKKIKSKAGRTGRVYVRPANPLVVISGECFVEGMAIYAKPYLPSNYRLVHKVGVSTYGMLNSNYFSYNDMTVTGIERIAYYHPDRVFFLIGMNEARNWNTTSTINNYKKMIQLLKKVNPHVEVVLLALPPVSANHVSGFADNDYINHYNEAYKNLAKNTENVYYYSGYRKLITDGNGYLMSYANGGDGGHWSSQATINALNDIKKYSDKLTRGK